MFQNLASRLSGVFDKLRHRGVLSEDDVNATLREIRQALLEADVALPAVKQFVEQIREKAVGQDVVRSITPGQMVVKIVHDHLVDFLGREVVELNLATQPPAVLFMVGLQGSGKTTTLYTMLDILNTPEVNISTTEDPIEYQMPRINQTQVKAEIGLTFANGLRT
ncbi:MAG: ATPase, T2SS/T4P/T4SS family, partial [Alphaproteobacteria bacterium]